MLWGGMQRYGRRHVKFVQIPFQPFFLRSAIPSTQAYYSSQPCCCSSDDRSSVCQHSADILPCAMQPCVTLTPHATTLSVLLYTVTPLNNHPPHCPPCSFTSPPPACRVPHTQLPELPGPLLCIHYASQHLYAPLPSLRLPPLPLFSPPAPVPCPYRVPPTPRPS